MGGSVLHDLFWIYATLWSFPLAMGAIWMAMYVDPLDPLRFRRSKDDDLPWNVRRFVLRAVWTLMVGWGTFCFWETTHEKGLDWFAVPALVSVLVIAIEFLLLRSRPAWTFTGSWLEVLSLLQVMSLGIATVVWLGVVAIDFIAYLLGSAWGNGSWRG